MTRMERNYRQNVSYKYEFWKMALTQLKRGRIENVFQIGMVAHHLITYARECVAGNMSASHYSEDGGDQERGGQGRAVAIRVPT